MSRRAEEAATVTAPGGAAQEVALEWAVERDGEYRTTYVPGTSGVHAVQLRAVVGKVAEAREAIAAIARKNGLVPLPSATNFVTIDCGRDGDYARKLLAELGRLGVFIRMPGVAPLDRCIRISLHNHRSRAGSRR